MTTLADDLPTRLRVIDSHTIGEPTRFVVDEAFAAGLATNPFA
jgi:hypothetical protein